jgi:hypothetical protein
VVLPDADLAKTPFRTVGLALIVESPAMQRGVLAHSASVEVGQADLGKFTLRCGGLLPRVEGRMNDVFVAHTATPANHFAGGAQSAAFMHASADLNPSGSL